MTSHHHRTPFNHPKSTVSSSVCRIEHLKSATCLDDNLRSPPGPDLPDPDYIRMRLEHHLRVAEHQRDQRLQHLLKLSGIPPPARVATTYAVDGNYRFQLDSEATRVLSALVTKRGFDLPSLVRIARGQFEADSRPNKALRPDIYATLLDGYEHCALMCEVARHGIRPPWKPEKMPSQRRPKNHQSSNRHLNAVIRSVRSGQDAGQYLVLDESILDHWHDVHVSPLGAVPKKGVDPRAEVRLIHNLSFPRGQSTNDASNKTQFPVVQYRHVAAVAERIEVCAERHPERAVCILKGDVKSAFRHLMMNSEHIHWMGARIPQVHALVFDMSAAFGWTGSPSYYGVFGGAISWLLGRESPASLCKGVSSDWEPFFAYEWVDDHILVESAMPGRLAAAATALRLAMMAVLGPRAINEDKFSQWSTRAEVLGLEFDTAARTVTMPQDKLDKARRRVTRLLTSSRSSRHDLECLLGSLRHICWCLRAAKPFFQRVQAAHKRAPRRGRVPTASVIKLDLQWFLCILSHGSWSALPTAMFRADPIIDTHLYMDASDSGLAVLDPARRRFIQLQFDDAELKLIARPAGSHEFTINVRELFCVSLAVILWSPEWIPAHPAEMTHVRVWSDNMSAVSWINRMYSDNTLAQDLIRTVGLYEATYRFRISANHLPGAINRIADAGSRVASTAHAEVWTNYVCSWLQTPTQALANPSRRKYAATWQQWKRWCASNSYPIWLSGDRRVDSWQLIQYAIWCWRSNGSGKGNAASTVLSKIGHVSWYHRCIQGFSVGLHEGHRLAMQGMSRLSPAPQRKRPITGTLLLRIRAQCNLTTAHDRVLWGAAVMGFFFLLRRSEYLADRSTVKWYAIQRRDISFTTAGGRTAKTLTQARAVSIRFRGGKTDQRGIGTTRTLERTELSWLCPVRACWYLVQHGIGSAIGDDEPLCSVRPQSPITATEMTKVIKTAAATAGENSSAYGTHSMRSGGATAMFIAGVDRLAIKHFGRWSSDCFEQYARMDGHTLADLASKMIGSDLIQTSQRQAQLRRIGGRSTPHPGWSSLTPK